MAEHFGRLPAVRADEATHVLDDPQDGNLYLLEHPQTSQRDTDGDVLRRRDDDRSRQGARLRQRELDIAGARWQIDQQVVELAPVDLPEKLLDQLRRHRTTPYDWRVLAC